MSQHNNIISLDLSNVFMKYMTEYQKCPKTLNVSYKKREILEINKITDIHFSSVQVHRLITDFCKNKRMAIRLIMNNFYDLVLFTLTQGVIFVEKI